MLQLQSTVNDIIQFDGIGVHSGLPCSVVIHPAKPNTGIVFSDKDRRSVRANYKNIANSELCTQLKNGDFSVSMVEHLCSAFYALGITNAQVIVSGPEIPILDGSALPIVKKVYTIGKKEQSAQRKVLKITKNIRVCAENDCRFVSLSPSDLITFDVLCDFSKKGLDVPEYEFSFTPESYIDLIAPARTFGFYEDKEFLQSHNLALGTSFDNTLVFDNRGAPMNKGGLRLSNEPTRHKILDAIGDISMSGYQIIGAYKARSPSHKLNHMLLEALFANDENYKVIA